MNPFVVTVITQVTEEQVANSLVGAIEGGSNYWYRDVSHLPYTVRDEPIRLILPVTITEDDGTENGAKHHLTKGKICRGLRVMASMHPRHFCREFPPDSDDYQGDASTADLFLQCCLFGEARYC